jgi:cell wall assembly regulator SMI1
MCMSAAASTPVDDLFQACCNADAARVAELVSTHSFTEVEIDRMVPNAAGSPEILRLLLARCKPSTESMFQLVNSNPTSNLDVFNQILALQPTPEQIGTMLDGCQSSFTTRSISYDEQGNETIEIITIPEADRARLGLLFERGLDAGGTPQNLTTLIGGMVEIGRSDLADRLAANLVDLGEVAFFGFRDRSTTVQEYVRTRTNLVGNVGQGALCGAVADGNEALVVDLLAHGANTTEGYQSSNGGAVMAPIECMSRSASAGIAKALVTAGAVVTPQSVANATANGNANVLRVLIESGGTDPDGMALLSATRANRADLISQLATTQTYPLDTLTIALITAREAKQPSTIAAIETLFAAQSLVAPAVPLPWQSSIDISTAPLADLWAEWVAFRKERLFAENTANPPATDVEVHEFQTAVDVQLPHDVMWLYKQGNGETTNVPFGCGMMFGERLLSLGEAKQFVADWQGVRQSIGDTPNEQEGAYATPAETIKCEYINARWIPLSDVNGNHIAVDLDPGPKGTVGQIISCGRDEVNKVQYGISLTEFIRSMLQKIAADNVEILQESGFNLGTDRTILSEATRKLIDTGW